MTVPSAGVGTPGSPSARFATAIGLGAFLLFQVQFILAKRLLPWFGGSPAVWTTCLLFFQVALFCGYAYAHLSTRFLAPGARVLVHCALLLSAVLLLRVAPGEDWKPLSGGGEPTMRILALLSAT